MPASLANAPYLADVVLTFHNLTGALPPLPPALVWLDLKGNRIERAPGGRGARQGRRGRV